MEDRTEKAILSGGIAFMLLCYLACGSFFATAFGLHGITRLLFILCWPAPFALAATAGGFALAIAIGVARFMFGASRP